MEALDDLDQGVAHLSPMRCTQVRDYLAAHKADLKQFWRRVRATKGKFWLLLVAGESEFVPSDPTATSLVVVKALCRADQFNTNFYDVRSVRRLAAAADSPLVGTIVTLIRENHSGDSEETFFGIEKPEDICSMTRVFIKDDSALAAGRLADLHVIAAGDSDEPDFSQVFSCQRRGDHSLVVTQSVEALFESAINERSSPIAVELRRRVDVLEGAALAATESRLAALDAFAREIEDILEEARASGKGSSLLFVGYQPRISIGAARGVETDFVARETTLRSFQNFGNMVRRAAGMGVRLLDCRVIDRNDGRSPAFVDLLPAPDKCFAKRIVVLVPDQYPFEDRNRGFPNEIDAAARRGCLFTAAVLDLFEAKPELLDDVFSSELDCFRPWVPASEEKREMLRTLGGAPLPKGNRFQQVVVFNADAVNPDRTPRFRTVAAVQAELAKARVAKKAEPHEALSGNSNSLKMEALDLEKMLVIDPDGEGLLNVDGARLLLAKWTEQVALFDDDNSYTVRWGGVAEAVAKDFKDIFRCGYNYPNAPKVNGARPKLKKAPLMRYYIEVLEGAIKDATGDEEKD